MNRLSACLAFLVATSFAFGQEPSGPPLELKFKQSCGLPAGRKQAYDPETGVFHVHFTESKRLGQYSGFYARTAFEVTKVAERFNKPVKFRLTGVPATYGCLGDPLALHVGGKIHPLIKDPLAYGPIDRTLFRVEHTKDVMTIEFTAKGQALLKPGAEISFQFDFAW